MPSSTPCRRPPTDEIGGGMVHAATSPTPAGLAPWTRLVDGFAAGYVGVPSVSGSRFVFERRPLSARQSRLEVLDEAAGPARIVEDQTGLAGAVGTPAFWNVSPSGSLLLAGAAGGDGGSGQRWVADISSGAVVDPVEGSGCPDSAVWVPGEAEVVYVPRAIPAGGTRGTAGGIVRRHQIGAGWGHDVVVFSAPAGARCRVGCLRDGRWVVVGVAGRPGVPAGLHLVPLDGAGPPVLLLEPSSSPVVVRPGPDGSLYAVVGAGSPGASISVLEAGAEAPAGWRELVPASPRAISEIAVCDDALVVLSHHEGRSHLAVHDRRTGCYGGEPALPTAGSVQRLTTSTRGGDRVWFHFTPVVPPGTVLWLDAATGELGTWAVPPRRLPLPPLHVDVDELEGRESTRLTVLTVRGTNHPAEPPRPALLAPSGEMSPARDFAVNGALLAWIASGGAYAVACVTDDDSVVDDLTRAVDHLTRTGRAVPGGVCLWARARGAAAAAAALRSRPDAFSAAIVSSPDIALVAGPNLLVTRPADGAGDERRGSLEPSRRAAVKAVAFAARRMGLQPWEPGPPS